MKDYFLARAPLVEFEDYAQGKDKGVACGDGGVSYPRVERFWGYNLASSRLCFPLPLNRGSIRITNLHVRLSRQELPLSS